MKKKIIFFGTPDFAVRSLSDLIKLKLNVIEASFKKTSLEEIFRTITSNNN